MKQRGEVGSDGRRWRGLPASSSGSSGSRDGLGGRGEKRKADEVDDLEAERVVGDVMVIDEVSKAMELESAEEEH